MKKFTKLFLSCAAVAAITASIATAAMADGGVSLTGDVSGTYNPTDGKLTITAPADIDDGTQATLLVYAAGKDRTQVASDDVVGVDQEAGVEFKNSGLKGTPQVPDEGNVKYTVALGYYSGGKFAVKEGTLLLGEEDGVDIQIGNVSGDKRLNSDDATCILYYDAGERLDVSKIGNVGKDITVTDNTGIKVGTVANGSVLKSGNVSGDTRLNSDDATCILYYDAGERLDVSKIGNVGVTIKGNMAE